MFYNNDYDIDLNLRIQRPLRFCEIIMFLDCYSGLYRVS